MNSRQVILALTAVVSCHAQLSAFAQSVPDDATVQKPDVRVGDRWTYVFTEAQDEAPRFRRIEVTFTSADAIVGTLDKGNGKPTDQVWTSSWNRTSTDNRSLVFEPNEGLLRFPLSAGTSYSAAWDFDYYKDEEARRAESLTSGHAERTVTVKGWETVEVPAGKFRALKIEATGSNTSRPAQPGRFVNAIDVIWYAPAVNGWVKRTHETRVTGRNPRKGDRVTRSWSEELQQYQPVAR